MVQLDLHDPFFSKVFGSRKLKDGACPSDRIDFLRSCKFFNFFLFALPLFFYLFVGSLESILHLASFMCAFAIPFKASTLALSIHNTTLSDSKLTLTLS